MTALRALPAFVVLALLSCTTRQPAQPPVQAAADAPPAAATPAPAEPAVPPPAPAPPPVAVVPGKTTAPQTCPAKRPEICTQQYQPVCASVDTGIRCIKAPCPSAEQKEFSNWCVACTNPKVISYVDGPCPGGGPRPSPESMPQ